MSNVIVRATHSGRGHNRTGFDKMKHRVLLGGYSSEVPPLPIPNREVKLTNADGTAYLGGRVGSRLFKEQAKWFAPFLFAYSTISFAQDLNWLLGCTHSTILTANFSLCTKPTALSAKIKRSKFCAICKKKGNLVVCAMRRLPTLSPK